MYSKNSDKNLLTFEALKSEDTHVQLRDAGRAHGVTRQAISQIASGKRKPGLRILRNLGLRPVVVYQKVGCSGGE